MVSLKRRQKRPVSFAINLHGHYPVCLRASPCGQQCRRMVLHGLSEQLSIDVKLLVRVIPNGQEAGTQGQVDWHACNQQKVLTSGNTAGQFQCLGARPVVVCFRRSGHLGCNPVPVALGAVQSRPLPSKA